MIKNLSLRAPLVAIAFGALALGASLAPSAAYAKHGGHGGHGGFGISAGFIRQ